MVAINDENREIVNQICKNLKLFNEEKDFGRFAFAYAISKKLDLEPKRDIQSGDTKWSWDSFDKGGELRAITEALHPEFDSEDAEKFIGYLINIGIEDIGKKILFGKLSITELLDLKSNPSDSNVAPSGRYEIIKTLMRCNHKVDSKNTSKTT